MTQDAAPTPAQEALARALGDGLTRSLAEGAPVSDALAVLCSLAANLITIDPDEGRGTAVVQAFSGGLAREVARVREFRRRADAPRPDASPG